MCGIVGVIHTRKQPVSAEEVGPMLRTLLRRGPDHHAVSTHRHMAFGHSRLSVLDLSELGNQPFRTADGSGLLVYNGEVYNFAALREALRKEGIRFSSDTDTEVVLQALHTWGPLEAIPRFDGMFAFAYADFRTDTVWLARDRLGIKPLFTARVRDKLLFASEQKALLAHPEVSGEMDVQSILSLLLYERFNDTETPYKAIRNFPPGTCMKICGARSAYTTFFDVARDIDVAEIADRSRRFEDTGRTFESALIESVERHMISDAPLATLCSGGLDSGLVTAIAAQRDPRLVCYVADMDGMRGEEHRRAALIAAHAGTSLRRVPIDQACFLTALPEAIAANDQPLFFAQEVALMLIARQMRADGFKVALSGDGADELFGGYTWYTDAYRRWRSLARRARWLPELDILHRLGAFVPGLRPPDLERELAGYALTNQPIEYVASSFNVAPVAGMTRTLRQRALFERLKALPLAERAFLARNFEDVYVHMRESLNAKDKMTMRYGIEGRVPFMDNALIRLGLNLPVTHKYRHGKRKALISRMARRWLPAGIIDLPKIGFTAPPVMWRGTLGLLQDGHVAALLKWPRGRSAEIAALLAPRRHFCFRLVCCELWLRQHLDAAIPEEQGERLLAATRQNGR